MDTEKKIEPVVAAPEPAKAESAQAPQENQANRIEASMADKPAGAAKPDAAPIIAAKADTRPDMGEAGHPRAMGARISWKSNRFAFLAATIAVAAGLGSIAGAAGYSGVSHMMAAPEAKPAPQVVRVDNSAEMKSLRETAAQLRTGFKQLNDNVNALRASLEGTGKGASPQLAKINDAVARLSENAERQERSHAETVQRLAKAADALDKLEKRAGVDVTGSVPTPTPKSRVADAKSTIPRPPEPPTVDGWRVRRVVDGDLAIVEGPDRVIEVVPGDTIRGVGRVHDIKKIGGRWAVLTASGLILSR
jgi:hypothetical protein